jgi:hypothetical protein
MFEKLYYELLMHLSILEEKCCYSLKTMIIMSPFTTFQCIVFFIGEFLQKFDLKNEILTNTKDFS